MEGKRLNKVVFDRICKHMNNDHKSAVMAFAMHYASPKNVNSAKMVSINPFSMQLKVDGKLISIEFDHTLKDSEDAHQTLVTMLKTLSNSSK